MAISGRIPWRRAAHPAAFSSSLVVVLLLAYLALSRALDPSHPGSGQIALEPAAPPAVEFDRFSARQERGANGERLNVSLRLRSTLPGSGVGFVFVVARNDHVTPRVWAIWPPQAYGQAITAGGHFHGSAPTSGEAIELSERWERLNAVIPHDPGQSPFDTVILYVVSPQGAVLLSRPFGI
ncbi:MAG: hypothetical protein HY699_01910 [Deltaproteobacteria bacterium]|nr:hypothetical protein [Deltaproteobacteria bacterium]